MDASDRRDVENAVLEGSISIEAALLGGMREVRRIYVQEGVQPRVYGRVSRLARGTATPVEFVPSDRIRELAQGRSHGRMLAEVGPRKFVPMLDLPLKPNDAFLAMIDGVEDPYNFGSAVRSLYAAGLDGLVLRPRNWMSASGVVARSSAGASEMLPIAITDSIEEAAHFFASRNIVLIALEQGSPRSLYDLDLRGPTALMIGGEQRGLTRSFKRVEAVRVSIPYARPFALSLGTAAVAAIVAFELARQRMLRDA